MTDTATTAAREPTLADFAASYVRQFGFSLVPLPPRSKRPTTGDWGRHLLTDPQQARSYYTEHPTANIGVALGPSRLCSLDVDDLEATRAIFAEFGWDLDALVRDHPTVQGQAPGFRVMFRVPEGVELPYHSLTWPNKDDPDGSIHRGMIAKAVAAEKDGRQAEADSLKAAARAFARFTVFEIRAAVETQRQDVLPPSIHPDTGRPYVWLTRPDAKVGIPAPPAYLLQVWANWDALKPQFQTVCPWAPKPELPRRREPVQAGPGGSVIEAYDRAHSITEALSRYGYRQQGRRWLSPHSSTGLPGVVVFERDNKAFIHHASDPLCSNSSGQPVAPFDLFCTFEHGGDVKKAVRAAGDALGMAMPQRQQPARQAPAPAPAPVVDPDTGEILEQPANDNAPASPTWQRPLDVFAEFPAPPILPGMLPRVLDDYAAECGELIGVEPAMVAIPALVTCAAALHDDVRIQPKRHETGWTESARLWCAIVGTPSVKKSPAIRRATKRLRKIDADLAEENARLAADRADQLEQYKEAKKQAKKDGTPIGQAPERPAMSRMIVEDITVEALSEVLKDNSRGVLCIQDELSGWFGSMDAYSGGKAGNKDRAAWLQAYNGGFRQVDRVLRGAVHIPNFSVSMIGGIQPDAIRRIAKDMTDDGLMQRFMVVIGRNAPELDRIERADVNRAFADLVDHLHRIKPGVEPVKLSEEAHLIREELMAYAGELADYPALPGGLRSHLGKWPGLFARLLLTYHAIECSEASVHPCNAVVLGETADSVARLMRRFLLPHAMAYYTDILGASGELEHARWVAGFALSRGLTEVTNRDLMQAYKQWRGMDDWRRQRVMQVLEDMGWVAPVIPEDRPTKRGATAWVVNPLVHEQFAAKAAEEADRRTRLREEVAAMQRPFDR